MFKDSIMMTSLVTEDANSFFNNRIIEGYIDGSAVWDLSFLSTLRALVTPRMHQDDEIVLQVADVGGGSYYIPPAELMSHFDERLALKRDAINIYQLHTDAPDDREMFHVIESEFCNFHHGWQRIGKVTDFFRRQFPVLCFICPDTKSVAVFAFNMNLAKIHYLQCSIIAFLPWYFNPSDGVSEDEMAVIESLRSKTSVDYMAAISKIASQYSFREAHIKRILDGIETRFFHAELTHLQDRMGRHMSELKRLNEKIEEVLSHKHDTETLMLGLERQIMNAGNNSEIMDYFLCNDSLEVQKVTDATIGFGVKTCLEYFDEEMAFSAINNKNSYIYNWCGDSISVEDAERFVRAIFIDKIFKVRFCAAYALDLLGTVTPKSGWLCRDYMPNPHIEHYLCMGNYTAIINQMMEDGNHIGAIEQCIASCKSLNFGDSAVMSNFFRDLYATTEKIIELPDGSIVTPQEAVARLKQKEENHNESTD